MNWIFIGSEILLVVGGAIMGFGVGTYRMQKRQARTERENLEFKRERLMPKPAPTQSSTALQEEDRPRARQSQAKILPRRGRKRS